MKEKATLILGAAALTIAAQAIVAGGIFMHDAIEDGLNYAYAKHKERYYKKELKKMQKKAEKTA
jgi:cytochrome c-type biogenesis protein CcmE